MTPEQKHYYAFVSHSSRDAKIALWLRDKLVNYNIPASIRKENQMPKRLRTLDPMALSFICMLSDTNKEDYRCYQFRQSNPTLWNS